MFFAGIFDEAEDGVDDVGIDDMLYVVLAPVEGQETHALDSRIIRTVTPSTVYHVGDLIQS